MRMAMVGFGRVKGCKATQAWLRKVVQTDCRVACCWLGCWLGWLRAGLAWCSRLPGCVGLFAACSLLVAVACCSSLKLRPKWPERARSRFRTWANNIRIELKK